jgi:hypothetical protein
MEEIWPDYPTTKIIFGMRMSIKNKQRKSLKEAFF